MIQPDNFSTLLKAGISSIDNSNSARSNLWQNASSVLSNLVAHMVNGGRLSSDNNSDTSAFMESSYRNQLSRVQSEATTRRLENTQPHYHSPYENYKAPGLITNTTPDMSKLRAIVDAQLLAYKALQAMQRNQMRNNGQIQKQQYLPMHEAIKQDIIQQQLETGLLQDLNYGLGDSNLAGNYAEAFNQTLRASEDNAYTQQALANLIASNIPEVSPFEQSIISDSPIHISANPAGYFSPFSVGGSPSDSDNNANTGYEFIEGQGYQLKVGEMEKRNAQDKIKKWIKEAKLPENLYNRYRNPVDLINDYNKAVTLEGRSESRLKNVIENKTSITFFDFLKYRFYERPDAVLTPFKMLTFKKENLSNLPTETKLWGDSLEKIVKSSIRMPNKWLTLEQPVKGVTVDLPYFESNDGIVYGQLRFDLLNASVHYNNNKRILTIKGNLYSQQELRPPTINEPYIRINAADTADFNIFTKRSIAGTMGTVVGALLLPGKDYKYFFIGDKPIEKHWEYTKKGKFIPLD